MKKYLLIAIAAVFLAATGLTSLSFAQKKDDAVKKGPMMEMMEKGMMNKEGMMDKTGMHKMMMMKGMMNQSMVATSDGGVIILMGRKLVKYDKDLNMVKEVELKGDPKMIEMMKDCPMMKDSMMEMPVAQ